MVLDREGSCADPVVWEIELPNGEYTVRRGARARVTVGRDVGTRHAKPFRDILGRLLV